MHICPPSRDTFNLCFKHKMVMQDLKNNVELLTDDASDDEAVNNQHIVDSATHIH